MTRTLLAALALFTAAACTSPGEPAQQQAGMNSACIEPHRIREHKVISNDEIQFTLAGGDVVSNKLRRSCPGLKAQGGFGWDVSNTLCPGLQTIYVLESGTPCQLGDFTRVATPATAG
jgi:hypothetical protein